MVKSEARAAARKSEIRITKLETNPKSKEENTKWEKAPSRFVL